MGAGVGEFAVEAAGAVQPWPEVEVAGVVGAVAGAAEWDDAVGVVASAVFARHDVGGVDGLAAADEAVAAADLGALGFGGGDEREWPHRAAAQGRGAPHDDDAPDSGRSESWCWPDAGRRRGGAGGRWWGWPARAVAPRRSASAALRR